MSLSFFQQIKIITIDKITSTNDFAIQRLKKGEANNGDIIVAGYQEAGRGQMQNTWFSSEGTNLMLSFICSDININVSQLPKLNMMVSLALHTSLNNFFPESTCIKWPNDILINEQKIAGILIETTMQGELIKNAVIGIGINVNEELFPDYLPHACSFFTLNKTYYDTDTILKMLIEHMDIQLSKLKHSSFDELKKEYEAVLFGMGVKRYFRSNGKNFEGIIRGINSSGQLCVESENEIKLFNHKEITFDLTKH